MTTSRILALLLLLAAPARAHLVPVFPATCALEIALSAPEAGVVATVAAPAPGDLLRASFDPDANPTRSRMQACPADSVEPAARCGAAVPRGFVAGAASGTLALPTAFAFRMLANGDLQASGVPITIDVGGSPLAVPCELATGVVLVGAAPVLGSPLDVAGRFRVVGSGSSAALPAPLGGTPLRLELGCTLAPPPDLDQFALAPRLAKVRGKLTATKAKLVMVLESEIAMPTDFAAVATVLRLGGADPALLERVLTLQAGSRGRFASADGALTIVPLKRRTSRAHKIVLRQSVSPSGPYASGEDTLALSSGGLTAVRPVSLKANGKGTRLVVRER
jgi:hypothetical protein